MPHCKRGSRSRAREWALPWARYGREDRTYHGADGTVDFSAAALGKSAGALPAGQDRVFHRGILPLPIPTGRLNSGELQKFEDFRLGGSVRFIVEHVGVRDFARFREQHILGAMYHPGLKQVLQRVAFALLLG